MVNGDFETHNQAYLLAGLKGLRACLEAGKLHESSDPEPNSTTARSGPMASANAWPWAWRISVSARVG